MRLLNFFTILLLVFTLVLYLYLIVNRRAIIIPIASSKKRYVIYPFLMGVFIWVAVTQAIDVDQRIRTILAGLILLSFVLDKKGLTEDRLILNSLDLKGIPLVEIDRVVLMEDELTQLVKVNYFRKDRRGPVLLFDETITELAIFFSTHLKEGSKLEIVTTED